MAGVKIHTHLIDKIAILNGFVSGLALLPQLVSAIIMDAYADLSATSFSLIFINSVVWTAYSLHRGLFSLLMASLLTGIVSLLLAVLALLN